MLKIGCHLSISGGYLDAAKIAKSIGANVFQYFSRNPRGGSSREVDLVDISAYKDFASKNNIVCALSHAPYTLNAGSATAATRHFAYDCFKGDIATLSHFNGNTNYVFHPGSHTTLPRDESLSYVIDILNRVITSGIAPIILLETMSGKGSELGTTFSELKFIIENIVNKDKIGVCLDTCHIYCAGYDIVNNLDGVLAEFDSTVGLNKLHAVHLNDTLNPLDSKKDRHACIGKGLIGADAIIKLINHPKLKHLPFYLETPNELDGYAKEIEFLKQNFSL